MGLFDFMSSPDINEGVKRGKRVLRCDGIVRRAAELFG